jgi:hypothetical protein
MKKNRILARKSVLNHPNGAAISTPLLIPSFSSKGFFFDPKGKSELDDIFFVASEYITDSMLISAYDIYYKNITKYKFSISDITIVDSGGYEISDFNDLSTVILSTNSKKEWSEDKLTEVYKSIPDDYPVVLVNYDHPDKRIQIKRQIEDARKFFRTLPNHLHTILIKPETKRQKYVQIESVVQNVSGLVNFDIIGFTEKELGDSILKRMIAISNIRLSLDEANIAKPIHIYGSLDPISSILYFISGAEIFDGLTWLRYAFMDGNACYFNNYGARVHGIGIDNDRTKAFMIRDNLSYLLKVKSQMERFLLDGDYLVFGKDTKLPELIEECGSLLRAKNRRIK